MHRLLRAAFGVAAACACMTVRDGQAAEGGVVNYAPGAPGPFVGLFPPIPGVFLLNQAFFEPRAHLDGADGQRSPLPISAGAEGVTERFIVAYPGTVLGAKLYQQLVLPLVNVSTDAFGQRNSTFGLGNVTVTPFILSWALDQKQNVLAGLDIATPFGSFDKNKALNAALNYTSIQPVLAYRYLDPAGFTIGVANRFLFNTTNDFTHYTSGTAFNVDFDVGYSLGDTRLGVVGAYTDQFESDRVLGAKVAGGNRYRALAIGPSVTESFGPVILNVNYQFKALAENTVKSDTLWVNLAVPLYTAPPPGAPPGTPGPAIPPGSSQAISARR